MKKRKIILTIEIETDLPQKDLKDINFICFGNGPIEGRKTVRRFMPVTEIHDCYGFIEQIQINSVK